MDNPNAGSTSGINPDVQQFGRALTLLVSNSAGQALDLSQLRIKFNVKKTGIMTPNSADIIVYNIQAETENLIQNEFTKVIIQGGYTGNYGVIFQGNIKQFIRGRESATDTFANLVCGDGDQAYNFATINKTLAAGSNPQDQLTVGSTSLAAMGVTPGYIGSLPSASLPRGKVIFANARDHLKRLADTHGFVWSMQDGNLVFLSQGTYLPNQAVVLTSKTGMIGTPQQTTEGIMCKCLLNPNLKVHGRVQVDNASIAQMKIDFWTPGSPANTPISLQWDGVYYALVVEHSGDTRGGEWYTNLRLLPIDISSNPLDSVQAGFGT